MWTGIVEVCPVGRLGYALLDGAPPATLAFTYAFAAGAILTMLATSMMPEAYRDAGEPVGFVTVVGFAVAFALSVLESSG